ncbi:MAG: hypothetical protein FJY10_10905 [Bacteroidetes bacterium]|nr:hypothetical protein [Bacteroidota bacterium]
MKITWIKKAKPKPFLYKPVYSRMDSDGMQEMPARPDENIRKEIGRRWRKRIRPAFGKQSMLVIYIVALIILLLWLFTS